jgi:hypothetical protein
VGRVKAAHYYYCIITVFLLLYYYYCIISSLLLLYWRLTFLICGIVCYPDALLLPSPHCAVLLCQSTLQQHDVTLKARKTRACFGSQRRAQDIHRGHSVAKNLASELNAFRDCDFAGVLRDVSNVDFVCFTATGTACRRQSNRISAQRSRAHKAQELRQLQEHLTALEDASRGLRSRLDEARAQEAQINQELLTLREIRLALLSQVGCFCC